MAKILMKTPGHRNLNVPAEWGDPSARVEAVLPPPSSRHPPPSQVIPDRQRSVDYFVSAVPGAPVFRKRTK